VSLLTKVFVIVIKAQRVQLLKEKPIC